MALSGVKCKVSNCNYWQQGERCNASAIEVDIDSGSSSARTSDQTNCHTFIVKS